jgi:hypothetical protein
LTIATIIDRWRNEFRDQAERAAAELKMCVTHTIASILFFVLNLFAVSHVLAFPWLISVLKKWLSESGFTNFEILAFTLLIPLAVSLWRMVQNGCNKFARASIRFKLIYHGETLQFQHAQYSCVKRK